MGKRFTNELLALDSTVDWAGECDVQALECFVKEVAELPLIAIGSGGSLTACHLTALLHRARYRRPAQFMTPLDALSISAGLHRAGVFLASASGKNKDVLRAFDACIADEAPAVAAITLSADNPLKEAASRYAKARIFADDLPTGKDGYLATNSLLATCTLITHAYGFEVSLPKAPQEEIDGSIFINRHMVQVLHGGWGSPVATDLESKLNESALAAAQLADYRNFGHGRHLWLAKRAAETVVVAIVTPEIAAIADSTLKLFPEEVTVIRLETSLDGPAGTIELLLRAFYLVGRIGEIRGEDPGRPNVPEFGRKLFRLTPPRIRPALNAAIQRKIWASPGDSVGINVFNQGYSSFLARARNCEIGAVALDYDGTLCSKDNRFGSLREDLVAECLRLLEAGIEIGIATGRGKSVREVLQKMLSRNLWKRVHIGYYNGTDISGLDDDESPKTDGPTEDVMKRALSLLQADRWLTAIARITPRPHQLTVELTGEITTGALAAHVMGRLAPLDGNDVRVVVSSHSLDILGSGRGKGALVSWLRQRIGNGRDVLCIGDRGAWPGNDYSLLAEPISLSVDEVSSLDDVGWNIAPLGVTGPEATKLYLQAIKTSNGVGAFVWNEQEQQ